MSHIICIAIIVLVLIILGIKAYGDYVQRLWDSMEEVPHRQEEIKRYSVEEIKQFNEVFENAREELRINKTKPFKK